jgi:hypothetical protein
MPWHPVRNLFPQSLLPLTALAALLAGGSHAHAGFVTPDSLVGRPNADSFMNSTPEADLDEMGAASTTGQNSVQEIDLPGADRAAHLESPGLPPSGSLLFGVFSGGAGCSSPDQGAGAGNSNQAPAAATPPHLNAPVLVGVLFLKTALRMPPPFSSRLFRPPRLS